MGNSGLIAARKNKNDEFYTQYETIEDELKHYKKQFEGKVIYCNCDDPRWSNFFKYFVDNFHKLKLKRLIASGYVDQSYNLFTINDKREPAVWADYDGWLVDGRVPDVSEIEVKELKGDGDFRSEESVELLKQADVVVTNPPFSLFRKHITQLIEYKKKFAILGNQNSINYRNVFTLIKNDNLWWGESIKSGDIEFEVPEKYIEGVDKFREDEKGRKYVRVTGVRWYTNIGKLPKRSLELTKTYKGNESSYLKYDNYKAINVDKTVDIPKDYGGVMGVPLTFLDKYSSSQFKIIGKSSLLDDGGLKIGNIETSVPLINNRSLYTRLFIQNKHLNPELYGG